MGEIQFLGDAQVTFMAESREILRIYLGDNGVLHVTASVEFQQAAEGFWDVLEMVAGARGHTLEVGRKQDEGQNIV